MKTDARTIAKIETAYFNYVAEVRESRLSPSSKRSYINHASRFVSWLRGESTPGLKAKGLG